MRATLSPNRVERFFATLIFSGVVQESRDRFIFVAAGVDHDAAYAKKVARIRNARALALLLPVQLACVY
jgi:hypothetical protein